MIRLLNVLAILGLIGSAIYAYSIKYDTLYQAGQVSKAKSQLHKERQAIAVLRAEWQLLTRPDRLQAHHDHSHHGHHGTVVDVVDQHGRQRPRRSRRRRTCRREGPERRADREAQGGRTQGRARRHHRAHRVRLG